MPTAHVPVLASELIDMLDPRPGETAIDCTFGGGGHARLVAERLGAGGTLVGIDRDPATQERFDELATEVDCELLLVRSEFASALAQLRDEGVAADVVYMDLGISSLQVDAAERGFSYSYDAPLDMRMDPAQPLSAADLVNEWPADRLASVLREYGEERHARAIAREIAHRRPLARTAELVEAVRAAVPPPIASGAAIRRSGRFRRFASPSTTSSTSSTVRCQSPGTSCATAAGSPPSHSTRSRTAA